MDAQNSSAEATIESIFHNIYSGMTLDEACQESGVPTIAYHKLAINRPEIIAEAKKTVRTQADNRLTHLNFREIMTFIEKSKALIEDEITEEDRSYINQVAEDFLEELFQERLEIYEKILHFHNVLKSESDELAQEAI